MLEERAPEVAASGLARGAIYDVAEELARKLRYRPGDPLEPVVARLGGRIEDRDFWQPDKGTASLEVRAPGDFTAYVQVGTIGTERRFSLAHELGHYVLHFLWPRRKGRGPDTLRVDRFDMGPAEDEANWFAASFLLPAKAFQEEYERQKRDVRALGASFGVPRDVVDARAIALGLNRGVPGVHTAG